MPPFPVSPRVGYRRNPLTEVICQVRFPTILGIVASPPADFQERIRNAYPDYRKQTPQPPPELAGVFGSGNFPVSPETITHQFWDGDGERFLALGSDFIALTERAYRSWGDFRSRVRAALTALELSHRPSSFSRTGLRYTNFVERTALGLDGTPWSDLINPALLGPLASETEIATALTDICHSEAGFSLEGGRQALIRYGLARRGAEGDLGFAIDSDFFTNERSNSDEVLASLDRFHDESGYLFRWATSDRLRNALRPGDN